MVLKVQAVPRHGTGVHVQHSAATLVALGSLGSQEQTTNPHEAWPVGGKPRQRIKTETCTCVKCGVG